MSTIPRTAMEKKTAPIDDIPNLNAVDTEVDLELLHVVPKEFAVQDGGTANWVVQRIVAARQYAEHVKEWAALEQRRAEREEKTLMFLFGRQLEAWTKGQIEQLNGRRKSLALPAGTVGFRSVGSKLVIDSEDVVLSWAKKNLPAAVVVIERLSKNAINDYAEQTGVIPDDGVHIEPPAERFFIR